MMIWEKWITIAKSGIVNTIDPIVKPILCLAEVSLSKHIINFHLILIRLPLRHHWSRDSFAYIEWILTENKAKEYWTPKSILSVTSIQTINRSLSSRGMSSNKTWCIIIRFVGKIVTKKASNRFFQNWLTAFMWLQYRMCSSVNAFTARWTLVMSTAL